MASKSQKKAKKIIKNTKKMIKKSAHPGRTIFLLFLLIVLVVGGYLAYRYYTGKKQREYDEMISTMKVETSLEVETYIQDKSLYSEKGITSIDNLVNEFKTKVQSATTEEEINDLVNTYKTKLSKIKKASEEGDEADLSIHVLQLDNKYAGDCIYIKAGETDILIDAGSRQSSASYIKEYIDDYVTDGILEYVIVTHADQDHIAAFVGPKHDGVYDQGIFGYYECSMIIDFPLTNKDTALYHNYVAVRDQEVANGATHYTALQCYNETDGAKRTYELADGIELEILYNYYYENHTSDENDYSVCCMINQGDKHFLFTGDLEGAGEKKLVEYNDLPEVEFFKSGHHGSYTANTVDLLSVIKPKVIAVSCVAGSDEYTKTNANMFPAQAAITNFSTLENVKVYCTRQISDNEDGFEAMNGTIIITSDATGVSVDCSNNMTELKDTDWFKENRTW